MYVYAAIGVAVIVAVSLVFEGGLEKVGQTLVTGVVGSPSLRLETGERRSKA
jgi:hypothetical protein